MLSTVYCSFFPVLCSFASIFHHTHNFLNEITVFYVLCGHEIRMTFKPLVYCSNVKCALWKCFFFRAIRLLPGSSIFYHHEFPVLLSSFSSKEICHIFLCFFCIVICIVRCARIAGKINRRWFISFFLQFNFLLVIYDEHLLKFVIYLLFGSMPVLDVAVGLGAYYLFFIIQMDSILCGDKKLSHSMDIFQHIH